MVLWTIYTNVKNIWGGGGGGGGGGGDICYSQIQWYYRY